MCDALFFNIISAVITFCLFIIVHSMNKTVGVFWLNAAETWIDISIENAKKVMVI